MESRVVGRVAAIFRYPVKSMSGESLDTAQVGWNGIDGDRRWAFVRDNMERSGFPWMTMRQLPEMGQYSPRLVDTEQPEKSDTIVRTPSGAELDVADPALASELGQGSRVIRSGRGLFDTLPLSMISTQTIAKLGAMTGRELDVRRFRPNILMEALDGADFPEDEWIGLTLSMGGMKMRVDKRDKRCVIVTIDPTTSEKDPSILRTITEQREKCLGVYGSTAATGAISIGDAVTIVD